MLKISKTITCHGNVNNLVYPNPVMGIVQLSNEQNEHITKERRPIY